MSYHNNSINVEFFLTPGQQCMYNHGRKEISKIQFWVYKASPNSFHLYFLSNGSSVLQKTVVASENLEGKLFKNNYC